MATIPRSKRRPPAPRPGPRRGDWTRQRLRERMGVSDPDWVEKVSANACVLSKGGRTFYEICDPKLGKYSLTGDTDLLPPRVRGKVAAACRRRAAASDDRQP